MTWPNSVVILEPAPARNPARGCQGDAFGGSRRGVARRRICDNAARAAPSRCHLLGSLAAALERSELWSAPGCVATGGGRSARARRNARARRRPLIYLLDINLISAAAPGRKRPRAPVEWLERVSLGRQVRRNWWEAVEHRYRRDRASPRAHLTHAKHAAF